MNEYFMNLIKESKGDIDSVAGKIAEELNQAVQEYEKIQKEDTKKKDAQALAEHYNAFMKMYCPEIHKTDLTGEDFLETITILTGLVDELDDLLGAFQKEKKIDVRAGHAPKNPKTLTEMIADMGW
jgi:hypothetical protein